MSPPGDAAVGAQPARLVLTLIDGGEREGSVGATAEGWVEITEMGVLASQREAAGNVGSRR